MKNGFIIESLWKRTPYPKIDPIISGVGLRMVTFGDKISGDVLIIGDISETKNQELQKP